MKSTNFPWNWNFLLNPVPNGSKIFSNKKSILENRVTKIGKMLTHSKDGITEEVLYFPSKKAEFAMSSDFEKTIPALMPKDFKSGVVEVSSARILEDGYDSIVRNSAGGNILTPEELIKFLVGLQKLVSRSWLSQQIYFFLNSGKKAFSAIMSGKDCVLFLQGANHQVFTIVLKVKKTKKSEKYFLCLHSRKFNDQFFKNFKGTTVIYL